MDSDNDSKVRGIEASPVLSEPKKVGNVKPMPRSNLNSNPRTLADRIHNPSPAFSYHSDLGDNVTPLVSIVSQPSIPHLALSSHSSMSNKNHSA